MYKNYAVYFLLITLSSCASAPQSYGIPSWEYEQRDKLEKSSGGLIRGTTLGGSFPGNPGMVVGALVGGSVRDEINLSPNTLNKLLFNALTEPTSDNMNFSTVPTWGSAATRWGVSESNEGQIITDWKPILGRNAGLGWWRKKYQTEVRHIITIKRSYRSSDFSNFSILTEVRERPNSNYKWDKADRELGRTSFEEIKRILLESVHKKLTANGAFKPNED